MFNTYFLQICQLVLLCLYDKNIEFKIPIMRTLELDKKLKSKDLKINSSVEYNDGIFKWIWSVSLLGIKQTLGVTYCQM